MRAIRISGTSLGATVSMAGDSFISDDPGTVLDSFDHVARPAVAMPAARAPAAAPSSEVLYRSPYRWPAPRIVICNDDSLDEGETIYVRSERIVIGRSSGDIVVGHDVAMSGSHAEVVRRDVGGRHAWVLRDLGSSNGTLVRVRTVTLRHGTTLLIGSKRYRVELPGALQPTPGKDEPGTALLSELAMVSGGVLPALLDATGGSNAGLTRYRFHAPRVRIGRPGFGNDIEFEDLCIAPTHAIATRDASGAWQLEAQKSINGLWVKIEAVRLTDNCLFQCGEQRFRFTVS